MQLRRIAIVGAGTAGWLAANHLGHALRAEPDVQISVIDSPDIPTIGVGEGTVPYIIKSLEKFGISEAELLLHCDATFKQGIRFENWRHADGAAVTQVKHFYHHPFDSPYPAGFDVTPYWLAFGQQRPYTDVGVQARLADLGLAPKQRSSPPYQGVLAYAYHFDARKFADLLAKNACSRFGVQRLSATIAEVRQRPDGWIDALQTRDGDWLEYDFYIDCSGFSSLLIDQTLQVPLVSKADQLLMDRALVQQVPLDPNEPIVPYTKARAHSAGWIWDIPLTTRRGTGFVYSRQFMSDEQALQQYAAYLGVAPESFAPRTLDMQVGYRAEFWRHNCVALGLAQGFVEPLEATSILVTDFSAEQLARQFPRTAADVAALTPYYNQVIQYVWQSVTDFIQLHYQLSDRTDSAFWRHVTQLPLSPALAQRLAMFELRPPQQMDFFSRFDLFNEKNYLYVLYGMGFVTRANALTAGELQQAQQLMAANEQLIKQAVDHLMPQRQWLAALKQALTTQTASAN